MACCSPPSDRGVFFAARRNAFSSTRDSGNFCQEDVMRILSKLLVLGAALTVSTSLAYADTLGEGSIDFSGVNRLTTTTLQFFGTQVDPIATGSLAPFAGGADSFQNLTSFTTLPVTPFFTVNNGTDTLNYYLSSASQTTSQPRLR